jgi:hypothetical protein
MDRMSDQKERMPRGELYQDSDPELMAKRTGCPGNPCRVIRTL